MIDTWKARQLLAELELVSHGTTASWNPAGGESAEKPVLPAGEPNPPHLILRARLDAALTQTQVDKVAQAARDALKHAKYTPPPAGTDPPFGSIHWKRWIAASDVKDAELARRFNVSRQYIGQVRRQWTPDSAVG